MKYRANWVGKIVIMDGVLAKVVGVCDDGAKCDYDSRRRAKETGELIVQVDGVTRQFYWLEKIVKVVEP